ncbi:MAG: lycopene cyclase family protein [Bacteroidetes bacterium]|nr:lycopene cyclase family protein [Bacteroidota bacterium]
MNNAQISNNYLSSYDYIIAGAGAAGLSLLHYLMDAPNLASKSILLIDRSFNKTNDRTWCFWNKEASAFEDLVHHSWPTISIHAEGFNKELPTAPFSYKMIQGIDFYNSILSKAKSKSNIHFREATILSIEVLDTSNKNKGASVRWEGGAAIGNYVFSSLLPFQMNQLATAAAYSNSLDSSTDSKNKFPFLWQHFKGRVVQFEAPVFNKSIAKLMDFNVPQQGSTAFMYQLPLNEREALVEYTIFSENVLDIAEYDKVLDAYLTKAFPSSVYKIAHEEIGAIPMTQIELASTQAPIYTIGALGAAIKASTGYAFQFIQEQCKNIVAQLENGLSIQTKVHTTRHQFYDAVLLHVLFHHKMEGAEIFKRIFAKNEAATVFKFLSNTSTLLEDIQIMRSLPTSVFLPAAIKVLLRRS